MFHMSPPTRAPEDAFYDLVAEKLRDWRGNIEPFDATKGVCLTGIKCRNAINGISDPLKMGTIDSVPVDERLCSVDMLMLSLEPRRTYFRTPLLCNAGPPGSGKSVLQAFNMHRFVKETRGIAIEITFSDDQQHFQLPECVDESEQRVFLVALAIRILHRVAEYMAGVAIDTSMFTKESEIVKGLFNVGDPLRFTLPIVRRLLAAPADTKVMLAVDDMRKSADTEDLDCLMETLRRSLDLDHSLYLSVSVLGCLELSKFSAWSGRPILLQSPPPISPLFRSHQSSLLPFVLQPFFVEEKRALLPSSADDQLGYSRISDLFHEAGGRPRQLQCLMAELSAANDTFRFIQSDFNKSSAEKFAEELRWWLDENKKESIIARMRAGCKLSGEITDLSGSQLKSLAIDVAAPFEMPMTQSELVWKGHPVTLNGTISGLCSMFGCNYFSDPRIASIPPPVLDLVAHSSAAHKHTEPEAVALVALGKALLEYRKRPVQRKKHKSQEKAGNTLANVFLRAFLLCARCNNFIYLNKLCLEAQWGKGVYLAVEGGPRVEYWDDVIQFPPIDEANCTPRSISESLGELISRLEANEECPGAVFQPLYTGKTGGNVFGLFRFLKGAIDDYKFRCYYEDYEHYCKYDYVLLNIHAKEYAPGKSSQLSRYRIAAWRKSNKAFPEDVITVRGLGGKSLKVARINLLMTSNEISSNSGRRKEFEGIITPQSMHNWLPTASFALESIDGLRKLYYA